MYLKLHSYIYFQKVKPNIATKSPTTAVYIVSLEELDNFILDKHFFFGVKLLSMEDWAKNIDVAYLPRSGVSPV